jgi:hypothetical protein
MIKCIIKINGDNILNSGEREVFVIIDKLVICTLGMFFNQHMYFLKIQGYETCMYIAGT